MKKFRCEQSYGQFSKGHGKSITLLPHKFVLFYFLDEFWKPIPYQNDVSQKHSSQYLKCQGQNRLIIFSYTFDQCKDR